MQLFSKPLELLILDVDGVLIDVIFGLRRALEATAVRFGLSVEPIQQCLTAVSLGQKIGKAGLKEGVREFWPRLTAEEALDFAWRFQEERRRNPWPSIDGSIAAIQWFKQRFVSVALCTTNDRETLDHNLRAASIEPSWFSAVSTWENGHPKPDPRAVDPIFVTVPIPREHAVYVGDWYPDLEAARGAGVRFIAVLSGGIPKHAFLREGVPEDHILERLADLPKLIAE